MRSGRVPRSHKRKRIEVEHVEQLDPAELDEAEDLARWERAGRVMRLRLPNEYQRLFRLGEAYIAALERTSESHDVFSLRMRHATRPGGPPN